MTAALRHPLHLLGIAAGAIGLAFGISTGLDDMFNFAAFSLGFLSATDLARRLGLEPPNDPAAPHNRGKL
jgi:hypothetical protein